MPLDPQRGCRASRNQARHGGCAGVYTKGASTPCTRPQHCIGAPNLPWPLAQGRGRHLNGGSPTQPRSVTSWDKGTGSSIPLPPAMSHTASGIASQPASWAHEGGPHRQGEGPRQEGFHPVPASQGESARTAQMTFQKCSVRQVPGTRRARHRG